MTDPVSVQSQAHERVCHEVYQIMDAVPAVRRVPILRATLEQYHAARVSRLLLEEVAPFLRTLTEAVELEKSDPKNVLENLIGLAA